MKGNVLVVGDSGVGKSTLINAVLGKDVAKTSWGDKGTQMQLDIYEGELFNIIDTIGFEPSFLKANKAINEVKKWSKKSAKVEHEDKQVNVIWFCVEGTSSKLFPKAIKDLARATSMWKSVPIITVITKSYSVPEREQNIELVHRVFEKSKTLSERLKAVIPVVASTYILNENASAPPEGITELIETTNELMPEGLKAAQKDVSKFNLGRKRALAQGSIALSVGTAVGKCFINLKVSDTKVLNAVEQTLVDTLVKIYDVDKEADIVKIIKENISNGTVNKIAKAAITAIEKLPIGDKLGATIINPLIAGIVVLMIGEGAATSFEHIYLGEDEDKEEQTLKHVFESEMVSQIVDNVKKAAYGLTEKSNPKEIAKAATNLLKKNTDKSTGNQE